MNYKRDREEIITLNELFFDDFRNRDWKNKNELFVDDVSLHLSITGIWNGIDQIEQAFDVSDMVPATSKQNVENQLLHIYRNTARSSFHILMIHVDQSEEFHYLQYGMSFVLSYKKIKSRWRIDSVKADLCWIEGNSYWVNAWNLIDYSLPKRRIPVIKVEDSIWNLPCLDLSDVDLINETVLSYGWIIDVEDYDRMNQVMKESIIIKDGYHEKTFYGIQEWKQFLITLNEKEACLHHTYQIDNIEIEGQDAKVRMVRMEPNRIGSKVIGNHNWKSDWFTLIYNINLEKDESLWKIKTVEFHKCIFERKSTGSFVYGS